MSALVLFLALFQLIDLGLRALFARRSRARARAFIDALHGERVPWHDLTNTSGDFLEELVRLEAARHAVFERARRESLVHLYHPLTPFSWWCGDRSAEGQGTTGRGDKRITCAACLARQPDYEALLEAQVLRLHRPRGDA